MLCFTAVVGGSGCSSVAAGTAILSSHHRDTLLVDLTGDQAALLGLDPGGDDTDLADWLVASDRAPDGLTRRERVVTDRLALLAVRELAGAAEFARALGLLGAVMAAESRSVVVDLGRLDGGVSDRTGRSNPDGFDQFLDRAERSVLVTRACYLSLRRAQRRSVPDEVVLVSEPNRALTRRDVEAALRSSVVAVVDWDPRVARAIDAGTLLRRVDRLMPGLAALT